MTSLDPKVRHSYPSSPVSNPLGALPKTFAVTAQRCACDGAMPLSGEVCSWNESVNHCNQDLRSCLKFRNLWFTEEKQKVGVAKTMFLSNGGFAWVAPAIFVIFVGFRGLRNKAPCFCGLNLNRHFRHFSSKPPVFVRGQKHRFQKDRFHNPEKGISKEGEDSKTFYRAMPSGGFHCWCFGVFGARESRPHDRALSAPRYCLDAH